MHIAEMSDQQFEAWCKRRVAESERKKCGRNVECVLEAHTHGACSRG